jgi:hypothetical protein
VHRDEAERDLAERLFRVEESRRIRSDEARDAQSLYWSASIGTSIRLGALFDYGYNLGRQGYPWKKIPPGWETPLGL